jgi:hypothetical protein
MVAVISSPDGKKRIHFSLSLSLSLSLDYRISKASVLSAFDTAL